MKGKQFAIVLGLLVLVGGTALYLSRRNEAEWRSSATATDAKILNFPLNEVAQVTIKSGNEEVNLTKKEDLWVVKERVDYAADFSKVSALLQKLWELRPVQDVKIGPSQLGRLQLSEPGAEANGGTLVDLKSTGDQRLSAVLLGKMYLRNSDQPAPGPSGGFPVGRYLMTQDGSKHVYLISQTLDEVQTKPEQWLDREFIKVENPKLIVVSSSTPGTNWSLTRENATTSWKLADAKPGENLDNAKASGLTNALAVATFADVLAPDAPVIETGLDKPSNVRIETFDNFTYEFRIGKLRGDNYPVLVSVAANPPKERVSAADEKPEDKAKLDQEFQARQKQLADKLEKEQKLKALPYLMAKATIEQLLKDRSALTVAEKSSTAPVAPGAAPVVSPAPGKSMKPSGPPTPSSSKRPR